MVCLPYHTTTTLLNQYSGAIFMWCRSIKLLLPMFYWIMLTKETCGFSCTQVSKELLNDQNMFSSQKRSAPRNFQLVSYWPEIFSPSRIFFDRWTEKCLKSLLKYVYILYRHVKCHLTGNTFLSGEDLKKSKLHTASCQVSEVHGLQKWSPGRVKWYENILLCSFISSFFNVLASQYLK